MGCSSCGGNKPKPKAVAPRKAGGSFRPTATITGRGYFGTPKVKFGSSSRGR